MKEKTVNAKNIIIRFLLVIAALFLLLNGVWLYFGQHLNLLRQNHPGGQADMPCLWGL